MRLVGIMPARNEAWVLRFSARAALQWVDHLILFDHASTEGTREIMDDVARETGRVTILEDLDPEWREMAHRQRMLEAARAAGATHIALVDADEVLTANLYDAIWKATSMLESGEVLSTPWLNLWRSLDMFRSDNSKHARQWLSLTFRDDPSLCWGGEERFHHRHPFNSRPGPRVPEVRSEGGVLHLQRASWHRARARQARYKVIERTRWPQKSIEEINGPYSESLDEAGLELTAVPTGWWPGNLDRGLIDNEAEPWEQGEVQGMVARYGRSEFAGLDLFGVDA